MDMKERLMDRLGQAVAALIFAIFVLLIIVSLFEVFRAMA